MLVKIGRWIVRYRLHLLMWFLVMAFSFLSYYNPRHGILTQLTNAVLVNGCQTIPFYLSAYVLIPRLLYKRKFTAFILSFLFLVVFMGLFTLFIARIGDNITQHSKQIIPGWTVLGPSISLFIWNSILAAFGSSGLKVMLDRFRIEKKLYEVEKEKINTELSFLRSQINPHFLFNVMNTIYFQIDKSNIDARQSVEKLSEMLRYQLYDCTTDKIQIYKELLYIQNYVAIQTLRMETDSDIRLDIDQQMENFMIAPLLILPIVENAFKHVSNFKEAAKNKIHLTFRKMDKFIFIIEAENTYDQLSDQKHILNSGGLGIQNLKRRLELLYPDKFELRTQIEANIYKTTLKLQYND